MIGIILRLFMPSGIIGGNPLVSLLIALAVFGAGWGYYEGRSGANAKHKAAQAEAILKDTKENARLSQEAQEIIERAQNATAKSDKKAFTEIEAIKGLSPMQCLDIRLIDIGLR